MEYFAKEDTIGVKSYKNNNSIEIQIDKDTKLYIKITINGFMLVIDRDFIIENITPNFTLEMFYYVLLEFIKYDNYSLLDTQNYYTFSGYYQEPYEQGDIIYITFNVHKLIAN
jgi:hypothetical protein